ncbi:MAG: GTP 3',8-cyclase MoaA [Myxococcota bacterium]
MGARPQSTLSLCYPARVMGSSSLPRAPLVDRFGRRIENLRISVTDRCDLRCFYCIPEDIEWLPRGELLSLEELGRVARLALESGVRRIRITGGEPLLRKDLPLLVEMISGLPGIEDLALTTNGTQLSRLAGPLKRAGLHRVNISLDSLDPSTFRAMTRRDAHANVLAGIDAAEAAGLWPVRINAVLVRGRNDGEVLDFARLARERGFEVRFIEFMPLEHGQRWGTDVMVPGHEAKDLIDSVFPLMPHPDRDPHAPSRDWLFADGAPGLVGFIDSVTQPFCAECNRIRLTADGKLRTCLFSLREHDLRTAIRSGESDEDLVRRLHGAVNTKEKKHHITDGLFVKPERTMSAIGG